MISNEHYEMPGKGDSKSGDERKKCEDQLLVIKFLLVLSSVLVAAVIATVIAIVVISMTSDDKDVTTTTRAFTTTTMKSSTTPRSTTTTETTVPTKTSVPTTKPISRVCETPHCKRTANRIEYLINRDVRPCDDFYEFACGGWIKKTILYPGQSRIFYTDTIHDIQTKIRDVLQEPANPNNLVALEKAKAFYRSCMDTESIEKADLKPLRDAFQQNRLAFPLLGIDDKTISFEKTVAGYERVGLESILTMFVMNDYKTSKRKKFWLALNDLTTLAHKEDYTNQRPIAVLRKYLFDLITAISRKTRSEINIIVQEIIDYEISVSKLWYGHGEYPREIDRYRRLTLKELKKEFPRGFDINEAFFEVIRPSGLTITEDDSIYIPDYKKLLQLGKLIADFPDKRVLKNILGLKAVRAFMPFLPQKLRRIEDTLKRVYFGLNPKLRWETCVDERFDFATSRLYAEKYFPLKNKHATKDLVTAMRAAAYEMLKQNQWMDDSTKNTALAKVKALGVDVAYPSWIFNDKELNFYYENVTVWKSNSLKSFITKKTADFEQKMLHYNIPVYKLWFYSPLGVYSVMGRFRNSFYVLAGYLQQPYFHVNYPMAMNFGGLGYILGREFFRAIDTRGQYNDENGDLVNWWTNKSREMYAEKLSCVADQYSGYVNERINKTLLGNMTKIRDATDITSLRMMFKGYRSWVENRGREEDRLAGLDFTPNQLFFINYAHQWCGKARRAYLLDVRSSSQDSYWKFSIHEEPLIFPFRYLSYIIPAMDAAKFDTVNGPVDSYKGFADAFNCRLGSPMNPGRKCKLW